MGENQYKSDRVLDCCVCEDQLEREDIQGLGEFRRLPS